MQCALKMLYFQIFVHRALKSAVVSRIFVHSALRNPLIAFRTAVISRIFVHCALKSPIISRIFVHCVLESAVISRIFVHCAFPCPKRRRFQVAIAAFGPFWEKIGRPWLNSTRRLLARQRVCVCVCAC